MGLTGSIVVYVCIWGIVFFSILPVGIKSKDQRFTGNIRGEDPGAPKNPKILTKFLYTTLITSIIFVVIYFMVIKDYVNLREYFN
ncbi:hypothetical protein JI56_00160 [SAR11 cluster bacterium PRT-SC02]|nr:hypothetical protein JI56_00160 [SAR11 cluster bacterium PRT-SC02]